MILVGNQRGGAKDLSDHLLSQDNDHVRVHELRGFASDNLPSALNEAYGVSRGTKCKQFLFSLSISPPLDKDVSTEDFVSVADRVEAELGLIGQPRAIVFHEKQGPGGTRRHAHAVWSRINVEEMKAVQLSHTGRKLVALTRQEFIERQWQMPRGLMVSEERGPNFSFAEWQQAKRAKAPAAEVKAAIQDCWAISDSRAAFAQALESRGFKLARGDRRGYVAIDRRGEPYAISRWAEVRAKVVQDKLGKIDMDWPSVEQRTQEFANETAARLETLREYEDRHATIERSRAARERADIVTRQRTERTAQEEEIRLRAEREAISRQSRFRTGLLGFVDRLTGRRAKLRDEIAREAKEAAQRDLARRDALIFAQSKRLREFEMRAQEVVQHRSVRREELETDLHALCGRVELPKSLAPAFQHAAEGQNRPLALEEDAAREARKEAHMQRRREEDAAREARRDRGPARTR